MATNFVTDMTRWTERARRNIDLVVKSSAQDVFQKMTRRQASVTETGGTFEVGKVPVLTGDLINSAESGVAGQVIGDGADSYILAVASARSGDRVEVVFTEPYAEVMEYGSINIQGRLFVRTAAEQWDSIVADNAQKFK